MFVGYNFTSSSLHFASRLTVTVTAFVVQWLVHDIAMQTSMVQSQARKELYVLEKFCLKMLPAQSLSFYLVKGERQGRKLVTTLIWSGLELTIPITNYLQSILFY